MSSFLASKLDTPSACPDTPYVKTSLRRAASSARVAAVVRGRIERGGERLWRLDDFRDLSFAAVAQALSRLARAGYIERLSKGVYYRARQTAVRQEPPQPRRDPEARRPAQDGLFRPASRLPISWDSPRRAPARGEVATSALSLPRKLVGQQTIVHARRPEAWSSLSDADAALLDFLRRGGRASELTPEETIRRTLALLCDGNRYQRLLEVAGHRAAARARDARRAG